MGSAPPRISDSSSSACTSTASRVCTLYPVQQSHQAQFHLCDQGTLEQYLDRMVELCSTAMPSAYQPFCHTVPHISCCQCAVVLLHRGWHSWLHWTGHQLLFFRNFPGQQCSDHCRLHRSRLIKSGWLPLFSHPVVLCCRYQCCAACLIGSMRISL